MYVNFLFYINMHSNSLSFLGISTHKISHQLYNFHQSRSIWVYRFVRVAVFQVSFMINKKYEKN